MGRSVTFSENVGKIPEDILEPYFRPFTSCQSDSFCQSLKQSPEALQQCARVIQRFIRTNIPHWRHFNNEKSRIMEEMDDVLVVKKGELERVSDCIEEMKREAEMEAAMECDGDEMQDNTDLKAQVEAQKKEVKELEVENARLKKDADSYRKKNKKIAMDTFSLYESFTQAVFEVKGLQSEQQRLEEISDQYAKCVKTLKGMSKVVKGDIKTVRKERQDLEECITHVIQILEERYCKRKLIDKLLKMKSSLSSRVDEYGELPIEV